MRRRDKGGEESKRRAHVASWERRGQARQFIKPCEGENARRQEGRAHTNMGAPQPQTSAQARVHQQGADGERRARCQPNVKERSTARNPALQHQNARVRVAICRAVAHHLRVAVQGERQRDEKYHFVLNMT